MDEITELRNAEKRIYSATINTHAAASAEASGATTTTAGTVTDDDGLTLSSAGMDTLDDEVTIYAKRTFHSYVTMHV